MFNPKFLIISCVIIYFNIFGQNVDYQRTFSPDTLATIGDTIWVTVQLVNNESDTLKGLVFSDQIPSKIGVIDNGIRINATAYHEYTYEVRYSGDVYPSHVSYRWIFQTPPNFAETGYLLPSDNATIEYGLTTNIETSFNFNQDAWYGGLSSADSLSPIFGFDSISLVNISFTNSGLNIPPVAVDDTTNTDENIPVVIDVLANDYDPDGVLVPSSVNIINVPNNGNTNIDTVTGEVTYTPNAGYSGSDIFSYTVIDDSSAVSNSADVTITIQAISTIENEVINLSNEFKLYQNFPNPFNTTTNILFSLPEKSNVKINIINVNGKIVATPINQYKSAGFHKVNINCNNLASGIYYYQTIINERLFDVRKMLLIK